MTKMFIEMTMLVENVLYIISNKREEKWSATEVENLTKKLQEEAKTTK